MKQLNILFTVLTGLCLVVFLQLVYQPYFYYIEQGQLFLWDAVYASDHLTSFGGVAEWISEGVIQYFGTPMVGAIVTGIALTLVAFLVGHLLRKLTTVRWISFLGWVPALFIVPIMVDFNYYQSGNVAFFMMLLALWGYSAIPSYRFRLPAGIVLTVWLAWWAGPVYSLFALLAFLFELQHPANSAKQRWGSILLLVEAALAAFYIYHICLANPFGKAWLPTYYYIRKLDAPNAIYAPWVALLVVCLIAHFLPQKKESPTPKQTYVTFALLVILIWGGGSAGFMKCIDRKSLRFMTLDHYSRMGEWKKIEENCKGKLTNYLYMSLLSRALVEQGRLLEDLFRYDIRSEKALSIEWNNTENISVLLSDFYFTCGTTAMSQRMAFEADVSAHGEHSARMLQRLVQTNLIMGAYPVAEKYIRLLEKSPVYRTWATSHRRFLYDDAKVEDDPLLGAKRELLFAEEDTSAVLISGSNFLPAVVEPLFANPAKSWASYQYTVAYYLLSCDFSNFMSVVNQFKPEAIEGKLPHTVQEGILMALDRTPELYKEYPLDEEIVARYAELKAQAISTNNRQELAGLLRRSYGDTFWYYLMFNSNRR